MLGVLIPEHGRDHRVLGGLLLGDRRPLQQAGDHGGQHLHMGQFLGADVEEHILVLAGNPGVPALEQVLERYGNLAPLPSEDLLELLGKDRVGARGLGMVLQALVVEEQVTHLLSH